MIAADCVITLRVGACVAQLGGEPLQVEGDARAARMGEVGK